MGFRFRKSVKIAPGFKVNLSKSGVSASFGGRGNTVNISKRGVRSTYTIPGTDISYVTQTSSSNNRNRAVYKELLKQQKEEEKQRLLTEAKEGYAAFQEKIQSLENILLNREKQPFNWEDLTKSKGEYKLEPYIPKDFIEPPKNFSESQIKKQIKSKRSKLYLITYFLIFWGLILIFQNVLYSMIILILALVNNTFDQKRLKKMYAEYLPVKLQEEIDKYNIEKQEAYKHYQKQIETEKLEHMRGEEEKRKIWEEDEKYRKRLRNAVDLEDLEPLAELLEIELANEVLPIPLVFDIAFNNVNSVNIYMELPDLDVVPEEKKFLTKTGKLSSRKMSQKDRFKLYSDICTGLTLRLIYETLRVIYSVNSVELFGVTEQINPANGHLEEIVSLHIKISRHDFKQLNLDSLDTTVAFNSLNGKFACSKKGKLSSLKIS